MEKKRQNIIERSFHLFHRYGIKSVSMDDIAREMGMSKKTLYQCVKDKGELVEAVMTYVRDFIGGAVNVFHDEKVNAIEQHLVHRNAFQEKFVHHNPTLSFDLRKYYPVIYHEMNEWKRKTVYDAHRANLQQGIKEGFYREDIDPDIIARLMVAHSIFTFDPTNEIFEPNSMNDQATIHQVYKYHFIGICTEEGLKECKRLFGHENENKNR
ncbi:TetR/AcrR family transcriptional regulator [Marinilabiliaceae bacterium JC017]|nr:TetR/AcrR family transcriptional regulator [Marinilabiliaceae bacterium JC017]